MEKLPPPESYAVAGERIRCLCALHRASVTSHVRTKARNAAVGGAELSKHQLEYGAMAWDLVPDHQPDMLDLVRNARVLGFWALNEGDHAHLQALAPSGGG